MKTNVLRLHLLAQQDLQQPENLQMRTTWNFLTRRISIVSSQSRSMLLTLSVAEEDGMLRRA